MRTVAIRADDPLFIESENRIRTESEEVKILLGGLGTSLLSDSTKVNPHRCCCHRCCVMNYLRPKWDSDGEMEEHEYQQLAQTEDRDKGVFHRQVTAYNEDMQLCC